MTFTCQTATGDNFGLGGAGGVNAKVGVRILTGNGAIGQSLGNIKFYIKKTGSPTGTCNLAVYNGGILQATGSSMDVSTLPTSFTDTVQFSISHTIAEDDDIVIESSAVPATINDSNQVSISQNTTNSDSTNIAVRYTLETFAPPTPAQWRTVSRNTYWCYETGSPPPPSSGTTTMPPPPAYVRL